MHAPAPRSPDTPPLKVGFVLARHFTLSAFSLFVDTLRLAADAGDRSRRLRCDWEILSAEGQMIRASCGVDLAPTARFREPGRFDYLVVVGGVLHLGAQIDDATTTFLRRAAKDGVALVGVCTGSFVLARAGLMRGRRACVSWYHLADYRQEFPDHDVAADRLYLEDGDRITCSGGAGAADLAAALVERHVDRASASKALSVLQIVAARGGAAAQPRSPLGLDVSDERIRHALLNMEQNVEHPLAVSVLARRVGLSVRQFERRFADETGSSPRDVYLAIRLGCGQRLVRHTARPLGTIAADVGFSSPAHFSRRYTAHFGLSPSADRRLGRGSAPEAAVWNLGEAAHDAAFTDTAPEGRRGPFQDDRANRRRQEMGTCA